MPRRLPWRSPRSAAVGLPGFRITVGPRRLLPRAAAALALPERPTERLRSAVDRKAEAELEALLREAPNLPPMVRRAVLALPRLTGDAAVLAEAEAFCLNSRDDGRAGRSARR